MATMGMTESAITTAEAHTTHTIHRETHLLRSMLHQAQQRTIHHTIAITATTEAKVRTCLHLHRGAILRAGDLNNRATGRINHSPKGMVAMLHSRPMGHRGRTSTDLRNKTTMVADTVVCREAEEKLCRTPGETFKRTPSSFFFPEQSCFHGIAMAFFGLM